MLGRQDLSHDDAPEDNVVRWAISAGDLFRPVRRPAGRFGEVRQDAVEALPVVGFLAGRRERDRQKQGGKLRQFLGTLRTEFGVRPLIVIGMNRPGQDCRIKPLQVEASSRFERQAFKGIAACGALVGGEARPCSCDCRLRRRKQGASSVLADRLTASRALIAVNARFGLRDTI